MAGSTFTLTTRFGISSGPTYQGASSVAPGVTGNNALLIDQVVGHAGVDQTIDGAITKANVEAYGFLATMTSLNANAGTPSITVKLVGAGPAAADLEYTLKDGESVAFIGNSTMTGNATAITCTPDATSDFVLSGIFQLTL